MAEGDTILIGRLQVRGVRGDPLVARLRLGHLLGGLELRPTGLSPAAILCVRRLADPSPGMLALDSPTPRPDLVWEWALTEAIARLALGAARPALGNVPAQAEAVFFADRAELLACLASDWLDGQLRTHWWWQLLCPGEPRVATVTAWRETPGDLPAALNHLDRRGRAVPFVVALGSTEAGNLAYGLAAAFGLVTLANHIATGASGMTDHRVPSSDELRRTPLTAQIVSGEAELLLQPPWSEGAAAATLPAPQRLLLGLGLALLRWPAVARGMTFARQAVAWYAAAVAAPPPFPPGALSSGLRRPQPPARSALLHDAQRRRPVDPAQSDVTETARKLLHGPPAALNLPPEPVHVTPKQEAGPLPLVAAEGGSTVDPAETSAIVPLPPAVAVANPATALAADLTSLPAPVITAYGGLFYLINLLLHMDLYGDFTTPEEPGVELALWDCLALVGSALIGPALRDDPGWPLLASLAGRSEGEEPGIGFAPPLCWRAPPAWLASLATPGAWRYATSAGRLRVWHPAGCWVLDVPTAHDPSAQLARELAVYGMPAPIPGAVPAPGVGDLPRWADWLTAAVRANLAAALGTAEDAATLLLAHQARIYASAARLDVIFRLDELPVAIRLAGFDRDPGWVPAGGRSIRFHFEGG